MPKDPPPELQIRVLPSPSSSRRIGGGSKIVHPLEAVVDPRPPSGAAPGGIEYGELRHLKRWWPWLVPTFVVVNTVMFIITMYVNDCPKNSVSCVAGFLGRFSFQPLKENPLLGPSSSTLQKMGALQVSRVADKHQVWLLITCIWLHGGVFHLLANMLSLLVIGIRLEQEFGFARIGLLYIISGFGGSLMSALFIQSNISVGASGALFGLLGGMLSELITNWTMYANKAAAFITLLLIIALNLAVGILPHVDNFAHIGGFLSGFFLGFVFLIRPHFGWVNQRYATSRYSTNSAQSKFKMYQCILWLVSLIILIAGFTLGMVMLLRGVDANDHCSWCHYLSCVPTSSWSCNTEPASCTASEIGSQLNITCVNNGHSGLYNLSNLTNSQIRGLCYQLCN
ncbi:hypothetical protein SAY86_031001 [Trapa natans]|uniref:RHOMBOID-like protein n=1 Tax=Trapa natans TaxID=22666 RepID=A0AAN7M3T0_TRANT|nr:hypothetical protein SAY86_031001 [Trapa natans]